MIIPTQMLNVASQNYWYITYIHRHKLCTGKVMDAFQVMWGIDEKAFLYLKLNK